MLWIYGDNRTHTASTGCIILTPPSGTAFREAAIMCLMLCVRALLAVSLSLAAAQKPPMEAKELLASIDRDGAKTVVKQLTAGDESQWQWVIHKIDLGSAAWLDVAKKLLPATDAGGTQDLQISLAVALTRNPNGVLSMVGPSLPIDHVCTVPFIEPDDKTVREHKRKVRAALNKVTAKALSAKKRECLQAISR